MTNLKKEFFFLRRQLRKRFSLFILGLLLCVMFSFFSNCTVHTYNSINEIPQNHVGNFKFMNYAGHEFVIQNGNNMSMNNFIHKYEIDNGQYKIAFALPASIAATFTYVILSMLIFSVMQRIDWHRRFLFEESNNKVQRRRAALNSLKKELNNSQSKDYSS